MNILLIYIFIQYHKKLSKHVHMLGKQFFLFHLLLHQHYMMHITGHILFHLYLSLKFHKVLDLFFQDILLHLDLCMFCFYTYYKLVHEYVRKDINLHLLRLNISSFSSGVASFICFLNSPSSFIG